MRDNLRERPPTARQLEVLHAIRRYTEAVGYPPTRRELATAIGLKNPQTQAVADHLRALQRRGLVTWERGKARTLRLTAEGEQAVGA